MVSILLGLAASNVGILAAEAPAYRIVMYYLLPLSIPLMLFNADLRRVIKSTGALLLAFLLGSGTVAFRIKHFYLFNFSLRASVTFHTFFLIVSCNDNWNFSSLSTGPDAITWPRFLENRCSIHE